MNKKYLANLIFAVAVLISATVIGDAQCAGCLDGSFGNGTGKVVVPMGPGGFYSEDMVIQSDGKILSVTGGFNSGMYLVRMNTDGTLDTSFGGGIVHFTWAFTSGSGTYYGKAYGLAIQWVNGQECILVAGVQAVETSKFNGNPQWLRVDRFLPDGRQDTSFGTNGSALINTGYALTVAVQPDGKILTVADAQVLTRLHANGKSLDSTFDGDGVVSIAGFSRSLAVDTAGNILAGCYVTFGPGTKRNLTSAVIRYKPNGALDTSFGVNGRATANFGGTSGARSIKILPDGRIVAGGLVDANSRDFAVARFTPTGQLDTSFSGDGMATYDFAGLKDEGWGMDVQSNGYIIMTGQVTLPGNVTDFGLVRFTDQGALDSSFGSGGRVTTNVLVDDFTRKARIWYDPLCPCEKIVMSGGEGFYQTFARYMTR